MRKTATMVCQTYPIARRHYDAAYERWMNNKGYPQYASQLQRGMCGECGSDLATASMSSHQRPSTGGQDYPGLYISHLRSIGLRNTGWPSHGQPHP